MTDQVHRRVLLVEDDRIIGAMLATMLEDAQFEVDGPHANLSDAMAALAGRMPDCAVLDILLERHQDVSLLASDLDKYGIPFVVCSGVPREARLASRFSNAFFVPKERAMGSLIPALEDALH